jgi:hypothetical protein
VYSVTPCLCVYVDHALDAGHKMRRFIVVIDCSRETEITRSHRVHRESTPTSDL